jgi:glycosyltransferase involved in cell wall biosynthesis
MKFHIVTPSFNSVEMLKLCMASIADQSCVGVVVHHHVQDGGSQDGTADYLESYFSDVQQKKAAGDMEGYSFSYCSEPDEGMYNAINRGWDRAAYDVDLIAWLNCDEQYLPGTLAFIAEKFESNATLGVAFGDLHMLDENGGFICYRKAHQPHWPMISADYLYTLSCTMFLRKLIFDSGIRLDEQYKAVADEDFVVRVLRNGYHSRHFKRYFSVFANTGENLSLTESAKAEARTFAMSAPRWVRRLRIPLKCVRLLAKLMNGCYRQPKPLRYQIFSSRSLEERTTFVVAAPTWKCKGFS